MFFLRSQEKRHGEMKNVNASLGDDGDDDDVLTLASSVGFQMKESALKATSSMLLIPVNTSL